MSQPVSSLWYPTLTQSHRVAVQFEVYSPGCTTLLYQSPVYLDPGQSRPDIIGTTEAPYPAITEGSVTIQKNQDQRSNCTMTLYDPTGFLVSSGILSPWGNELRLYRGISYGDEGPFELKLLGTFRITDVNSNDIGQGVQIQVLGADRSRLISRAKVVQFYQTASNQAYSDAIRAACIFNYPGIQFNDSAAAWQTVPPAGIGLQNGSNPQMIFTPTIYGITFQEGDDMWTESRNLARSIACDLYFDRPGVCVLQQDPNLNYMNGSLPTIPAPVFSFVEGETCTMTGVQQKYSDADVYNEWVITGEGQIIGYTQSPIRSIPPAIDNDPKSTTYIGGPYGRVVGFETNNLMVTQGQINTYAQFKLATSIGKQQTIQVTGFVDTSLDIDDPIAITRTPLNIINQLFIIDTLQFPLVVGQLMTMKTRERRALIYGATS